MVKTLKGTHFEIRVQHHDTIMAVKKKIEEIQGKDSYPRGQQMLIYKDKVLKDESTLDENQVTDDEFLVVMLSKPREFRSMEDFWVFYLGQHSKPATRRWHFAGTVASLVCALLAAAATGRASLLASPVLGYGMAWYSHIFVESNRPATFGHPVWFLLCEYRMFVLILTGRIDAELARLLIRLPSDATVHHE
ncbi:uncharacterized protein LOC124695248 [Lolium rigidum]|uniref:uncharacterized protein LOC124695248 n=1 Tax=Lolium rigidum TaxID=89674 RepID=UPI001F5D1B63|nr:uncharacterized protein LOC124695248 [Lolium rigidum]